MSYAALLGRIQQDLTDLDQLQRQTGRLLEKVKATGDSDYLGTVALNLHSFYTGTERIFQEIARDIDQSLPNGADWHRRLLRQMATEIPNVRPPVIALQTRNALNEYCSFRHVVRNIYTFELQPERVQALASELPDCYQVFSKDLQEFCRFLEALA